MASLREYARLGRVRFNNGYAGFIEVLYAENELFAAELAAVRTNADRYIQLIAVYKAVGGGWIDLADQGTAAGRIAHQKLKDQQVAQERLVAALKSYAYLAKLQYDGGYTSYTTVLQAEQSLFPAELTLAAVRASVYSSSVNIYKAMGGGWVVEADRLTVDKAPPVAKRSTGMPLLF